MLTTKKKPSRAWEEKENNNERRKLGEDTKDREKRWKVEIKSKEKKMEVLGGGETEEEKVRGRLEKDT